VMVVSTSIQNKSTQVMEFQTNACISPHIISLLEFMRQCAIVIYFYLLPQSIHVQLSPNCRLYIGLTKDLYIGFSFSLLRTRFYLVVECLAIMCSVGLKYQQKVDKTSNRRNLKKMYAHFRHI